MDLSNIPFTVAGLRELYREGRAKPIDVILEALRRAWDPAHPSVWITLLTSEQVRLYVDALDPERFKELPLFGIPFAIKDNLDLAGIPTTCACPDFAYLPKNSAYVVERLIKAGAVPIGKTNLDQFATGLVGTRSPYGACHSVFDARYVSGGSSSGSAVAVASGMVAFALGTDTAGSGRVPAAFNNVVGLKPTRGRLSNRGVVPACRSLDCISILASTCYDGAAVLAAAEARDPEDPFSRAPLERPLAEGAIRFGRPRSSQLEFFGNEEARRLYDEACQRMAALGAEQIEFDYEPFLEAASLLYAGPWVAERYSAVGEFLEKRPEAMDPTVRAIISEGKRYSAVDAFRGLYELEAYAAQARNIWEKIDILLLPTTGTTYTIKDVKNEPVRLNSNLGRYTNFVNLLDLAAVAVPAGFGQSESLPGLPFGVSLIGPAFSDRALLSWGDRLHRAIGDRLGGTGFNVSLQPSFEILNGKNRVEIAVVGAHLRGQPLNHQLSNRGAQFVIATETAPFYRLYHLAKTMPPKPGLVRVEEQLGHGIDIEVWSLDRDAFGDFVAEVPPPMAIGTLELASGKNVKGFVCEPCALAGAKDITGNRGWRSYLASLEATPKTPDFAPSSILRDATSGKPSAPGTL
jgi:allophanate hydrolase